MVPEGDFVQFGSQESKDGYDFIEWAAEQPWCNGRCGMVGNSCLAMTQWLIAAQQPPHRSVGAGMVIITTLGGSLGAMGFRFAYLVNIIAFISFMVIAFCLPDTGKTVVAGSSGIKLTKDVFIVAVLGMLELLFLITFATNIAMYLSGSLAGNSAASGTLTGFFSAAQIIMGLILKTVTNITGKYTLPTAMLCFCAGAILLIVFPGNFLCLTAGAVLCGFSQGMFIPQAMCEVTAAVEPAATAMAAACFTCFNCFGQIISPIVLNKGSQLLLVRHRQQPVYIFWQPAGWHCQLRQQSL